MSGSYILIVGCVLGAFIGLRQLGLISVKAARTRLQQGALVVDVRSPEEFKSGHLSEAVNIPLNELADSVPRTIADKNQVLLLHCLSGTRSGIAKRLLKKLGYPNVYNLGSYGRAKRILSR